MFSLSLSKPILFFSGTAKSNRQQQTSAALKRVPKADQKLMEDLFRKMYKEDCMGYVMQGVKPMCFTDLSGIELKGWQHWQKNAARFALSPRFILNTMPYTTIYNDRKFPKTWRVMNFINRNAALALIKKEWGVFQQELASAFPDQRWSPGKVLKMLATDNPVSRFVLGHDGLLGMLLGFGKHNAMLFHRMHQLENSGFKPVTVAEGFRTARQELKAVQRELYRDREFCPRAYEGIPFRKGHVDPPYFIASPTDPESAPLLKRYAEITPKVQALFEAPNFLEALLAKLRKRQSATSPEK